MPRTPLPNSLITIPLDANDPTPMFRQLYNGLRDSILNGTLPPGTRLPASRAWANELGVSRNTVMNAYEQLLAEGYLEGREGSGTYVPSTLPDERLQATPTAPAQPLQVERPTLSHRGQRIAAISATAIHLSGTPRAFRPGFPALDAFPFDLWHSLSARHTRNPSPGLLGYDDPAGYHPLREAIASYLGTSRAVHCSADQIVIVNGSQQALDLVARVLLDPDDAVWVENPGYPGARGAMLAAGAKIFPQPVDREGLDVQRAAQQCPIARLAIVTPSHQFPMGVTMSLSRRLALLEWARKANAWIIEDDYDSEFRYAGRPLASLQGIDRDGRVIYIGTFSKVLFPALRLGYLVVPRDVVDAFIAARALVDRHSPTQIQAILTDFITEGHFARHLRRMRVLYAERQEMLLEIARKEWAGWIEVTPADAGMHVIGYLNDEDDLSVSRAAAEIGIEAPALSVHAIGPIPRPGLMLGYAVCDRRGLREAARRLAKVKQR